MLTMTCDRCGAGVKPETGGNRLQFSNGKEISVDLCEVCVNVVYVDFVGYFAAMEKSNVDR